MSGDKQEIDPEAISLFRDAMKSVTPLKKVPRKPTPTTKKIRTPAPLKKPHKTLAPPFIFSEQIEVLDANTSVLFIKTGLPTKTIQRLKRGTFTLEATLDLHRKTIAEAIPTLEIFIENCLIQKKRWACMIPGKGNYSKTGTPVLKNFLNQWLRTHPYVLAFASAKPKHGGSGAFYVLLKTKGIP